MTLQILIVDDEPHVVESLSVLLESDKQYDIEIHTAYRAQQALDIMHSNKIDLLLTDIEMPGMNGLLLIKESKQLWPDCFSVILSAYSNFDYAYEAFNQQVSDYILKTEDEGVILFRLQSVLNKIINVHNHREWLSYEAEPVRFSDPLNQSLLIKLLHDAHSDELRTKKLLTQAGFHTSNTLVPILAFTQRNQKIDYALLHQALVHYIGKRITQMSLAPLDTDKFFILLEFPSVDVSLFSVLESVQTAIQNTGNIEISFIISSPYDVQNQLISVCRKLIKKAEVMQTSFETCVVSEDQLNSSGQITVDFLKKYIASHIYEDLSLSVLSQVTGYNASYLSRVFSSEAKETLVRYIARKRMAAIRKLMLDHTLSLDQIMQQCNFSSRSYFNCFVKKETGLSPKKYRAQLSDQ